MFVARKQRTEVIGLICNLRDGANTESTSTLTSEINPNLWAARYRSSNLCRLVAASSATG